MERHLNPMVFIPIILLKGGERLGSYYLEEGAGERSSQVTYDRKYSSISQLRLMRLRLKESYKGVSLFHITGITPSIVACFTGISSSEFKKAKEIGVLDKL